MKSSRYINNNKLVNIMVKPAFMFIFISVLLLSFAAATETTIGTKTQDDCIDLIQTCADCSYVNFTSYTMPNGTRNVVEWASIQDGVSFTYNSCNITGQAGTWIIDGHGDAAALDTVFTYTYEVTSTGKPTPIGMPTFMMGLIFIIFATGGFMLYLSSTMHEPALKIFFLITSLIFLMAAMITGYMVSTDGNTSSQISSTTLGLVTVLGIILFLVFIYILIRQTVAALDTLKIKKGLKMDNNVGYGGRVVGYNNRRPF